MPSPAHPFAVSGKNKSSRQIRDPSGTEPGKPAAFPLFSLCTLDFAEKASTL